MLAAANGVPHTLFLALDAPNHKRLLGLEAAARPVITSLRLRRLVNGMPRSSIEEARANRAYGYRMIQVV